MQPQLQERFPESPFQGFGSVRSPIQCEGIERGHRRIAEIGVSGAVNPQLFGIDIPWGDIAKWGLGQIAQRL